MLLLMMIHVIACNNGRSYRKLMRDAWDPDGAEHSRRSGYRNADGGVGPTGVAAEPRGAENPLACNSIPRVSMW